MQTREEYPHLESKQDSEETNQVSRNVQRLSDLKAFTAKQAGYAAMRDHIETLVRTDLEDLAHHYSRCIESQGEYDEDQIDD